MRLETRRFFPKLLGDSISYNTSKIVRKSLFFNNNNFMSLLNYSINLLENFEFWRQTVFDFIRFLVSFSSSFVDLSPWQIRIDRSSDHHFFVASFSAPAELLLCVVWSAKSFRSKTLQRTNKDVGDSIGFRMSIEFQGFLFKFS